MLSVKMHQTKAISWNQAKSVDDAAEKFCQQRRQEDTCRSHTIARERIGTIEQDISELKTKPQMRRKVHQDKEELFQEFSKENGKDNDELMEFAARFNRQDAAVQLQQETRSLKRPRMQRLPKVVWRS